VIAKAGPERMEGIFVDAVFEGGYFRPEGQAELVRAADIIRLNGTQARDTGGTRRL
jgi:hypothetical protein